MFQYGYFAGLNRFGAALQVDDHFVVAVVPAEAGYKFFGASVQDWSAQLLGAVYAQVVFVGLVPPVASRAHAGHQFHSRNPPNTIAPMTISAALGG
jgi:hypothetical protein